MDRFDAITAFAAVAELNGFAPAARKLGISPSAATRLIAGLEERLGVRLLNRTTRSISLTDAGARFLERSKRILTDLEEAERMVESELGEPAGRLVVSAPEVFGRLHVAPLLCQFMNAHQKVQAELLLANRVMNLVEEGVDLAVRIGVLSNSADIARRLGETRRVLVASADYLAKAGVPETPEDLARHRLISFTSVTHPQHWRFKDNGRDREVKVDPAYVTNSADAALFHAGQSGGITMALSYQVAAFSARVPLQCVLTDFEPQPLPIQFVYPNSRLLSPKVRGLIDLAAKTQNWSFLEL